MQSADVMQEAQAQTCLSTRWLGEPKSPLVHQWVLDIEVVLVVEDSDLLILSARCWLLVLVTVGTLWRNGDGGQINWGRGIDRRLWGDCCHDCEYVGVCWRREESTMP